MSLNWNLSDIKNWKDICYIKEEDGTETLNPVTNAIIWSTMVVDICKVTDNNINEWMWRFAYMKQLKRGELLVVSQTRRNPRRDELMAHIGLRTNANNLNHRDFVSKIAKIMKHKADMEV